MNYTYFDFPIYTDAADLERHVDDQHEIQYYVFLKEVDYTTEHKELLRKILQAMGILGQSFTKVIILKENERVNFAAYFPTDSKKYYLAFGLNAGTLGLNIKTIPYQHLTIGSLSVLFAHSLKDLNKSIPYKKQLWAQLQTFKPKE